MLPFDCLTHIAEHLTRISLHTVVVLASCSHETRQLLKLVAASAVDVLRDAMRPMEWPFAENRLRVPLLQYFYQTAQLDPGARFLSTIALEQVVPPDKAVLALRLFYAIWNREHLLNGMSDTYWPKARGEFASPSREWGHETKLCDLYFLANDGVERPLHKHPRITVMRDEPHDAEGAMRIIAESGADTFKLLVCQKLLEDCRSPHRQRALARSLIDKPLTTPDGTETMERVAVDGRAIYVHATAMADLPQLIRCPGGSAEQKQDAARYHRDKDYRDLFIGGQTAVFCQNLNQAVDDEWGPENWRYKRMIGHFGKS